jgi:anti-sigma factor RsiW
MANQQEPLDDRDREDLIAYLDGEADAKTARSIEAKLATDAEARKEAEALKRAWDMLDYLPRPEPSANFTNRTMERVSTQMAVIQGRRQQIRPWLLGLGWAAAILIAAIGGFAGTSIFIKQNDNRLDQQLVHELPSIQNARTFEHVDDIDFLHKLANPNDPDLFGDDTGIGS